MYSSPIYRSSPVRLQEAMLSARAAVRKWAREDRKFRVMLDEALARAKPDGNALAWRGTQMRTLLARAAIEVPFYAERIDPLWLDTLSIEEVLTRLPVLRKNDVAGQSEALQARDLAGRRRFWGSTSGTSGTPLKLARTLDSIRFENAQVWRQMRWAGLADGARRVWLRGDMVVAASQQKPPFWRHNRQEKMLMMSSYHLSDASAPHYLKAMREFSPAVIQAYPSAIGFLANWLWSRGECCAIQGLRGIMTSSETLTADVRAKVEHVFGVQVFDWYGSFERVAAIGTCEHGRQHVIEDYGYVEFLPAEGGLHEVVGTGFGNALMPLIRYATGDLVELADPAESCACQRPWRLVNAVHGRMDDCIFTPDGRAIGRLDHIFKGVEGLLEAQIVQNEIDAVDVRVVLGPGADVKALAARIGINARERLGDVMRIEVHPVPEVPRTATGKLRAVICNVTRPD